MSAAARVMMAEGCFMVTESNGRSITFRSYQRALDYAEMVLRDQKAAQHSKAGAAGDYRLREVRRSGSLVFEVINRAGVAVAALSSRDLALRKIDALERQARAKVKPCITCKRPFKSEGAHNRMCADCNARAQNAVWI